MSTLSPIFASMVVPADDVSIDEAVAVARAHWGIEGTAKLLTGERDRNFHLVATDGREFVLKFANPAEPAGVTDLQVKALLHVAETDPGMVVPRIVRLPGGAVEAVVARPAGPARVRLLSWVAGIPLRHAPRSGVQRENCGRVLARLGLALERFSHPHDGYELIWDLNRALYLREVLGAVEDAAARAAIGAVIDDFEREAVPVLAGLRRQVLYNDMNHGNTIVDPDHPDRVVGIIDFGDIARTAVAIDVAVGATAMLAPDMAVADGVGRFVRGFHAVRPLLREEAGLVPLLAALRVGMSTVQQAWHRQTHVDNPHYARMSGEELGRRISRMAALRGGDVREAVLGACGFA
jgi:Ser/Thr protein kinase RdoA (MazF antagonist)